MRQRNANTPLADGQVSAAIVLLVTADPRGLPLRIVALAGLLFGAVVVTAKVDAWWMVTIAVAGLVIAAGGIGVSVARMLRADDSVPPGSGGRSVVAAAVVGVAAVVLAIALASEESSGASVARPTAASADQTIRDFLAGSVLDDNAYAACGYLTPHAQEGIARSAGDDETCRDALSATRPSFAAIQSEGTLHALRLRAVVRDGTADVTATPREGPPVTFVLRRTTGDEAAAYEAPPTAWRIARGATAVLPFLSGRP
jgi:hypothetical protein